MPPATVPSEARFRLPRAPQYRSLCGSASMLVPGSLSFPDNAEICGKQVRRESLLTTR